MPETASTGGWDWASGTRADRIGGKDPSLPRGRERGEGALLSGAIEHLVIRIEILGRDDGRRQRREIRHALAARERVGELRGLGAFLIERLRDDAVGAASLHDVEILSDVVHADDDQLASGLAGGAGPGLDAIARRRKRGGDIRIAL